MIKIFKLLFTINYIRSIYINFKCFGLKSAIRFPIIIHGKLSVHSLHGRIVLDSPIRTGMVRIGVHKVGIFPRNLTTTLNILGDVKFKGKAVIGRGSSISVSNGSHLTIGNNFQITGKSSIICAGRKKISIEDNCLLSWDILLMNNDFHKIIDLTTHDLVNPAGDILIGNDVWIGCGAVILKNSVIHPFSVIATNSTVTGNLQSSNSIFAGTPAKKIKDNIYWKE